MRHLAQLIGNSFSAAVIPFPFGAAWCPREIDFGLTVRRASGEIILHGFSHQRSRPASPWSSLINHADEFAALSSGEAERRIERGMRILTDIFGQPPLGFVAPAWRSGKVTMRMLHDRGIRYSMRMSVLERLGAPGIPLATWSWDCGKIASAGWLGALAGWALTLRRAAIPCIVIHPADVERGFMRHALSKIESLLNRGYQPVLPQYFLER